MLKRSRMYYHQYLSRLNVRVVVGGDFAGFVDMLL